MKGESETRRVRPALDALVADALRPVSAGLALVYAVHGAVHFFANGHPLHVAEGIEAWATALILLGLFAAFRLRPVPPRLAHPVAAAFAGLVLANSVPDIVFGGTADETVPFMFVMIGAGALFLSWRWLWVVLSAAAASWLSVALIKGAADPSEWVEFGTYLAISMALAVVIHAVRLGAFVRLERDRQRFAGLIENALDITIVVDGEATIRYLSPSVERVLGWKPEELIEKPGFALVHPDDLQAAALFLAERSNVPGPTPPIELRYRHKDGSWRVIEAVANNLLDDPAIGGIVVNARDITRRKRAEEELRETEAKYRALVEEIPAITYIDVIDPEIPKRASESYVSPQFESMLGYTVEEMQADPDLWNRLIHPEDRELALAADDHHYATGEPLDSQYRMIAGNGRVLWVHDRAVIVRGQAGRAVYSQGVVFDVTERKDEEQKLRESEAELHRTIEILRRTDEERRKLLAHVLSQEQEERGRMAEGIEDEQIQSIAAVGMRLETLRSGLSDPKQLGALDQLGETVKETVNRLRHLLVELRPRALETDGLAAALHLYLQRAAAEAGLAFAVEDRMAVEPAEGARAVAYRIAQDAVANVVDHARASRVDVSLLEVDGGFLLRIADDGLGFHPPGLEEPWPQHAGLAAMRQRAELAGGWLRIRSQQGAGTMVELWLPAGESAPGP